MNTVNHVVNQAGPAWNPALEALPLSGIRKMFNTAATMKDVIHLSIGQPDFPTPPHVIQAYVAALEAGKTGYTLDAGLPELLGALAPYYGQRYGRPLKPDNLLETTGACEGIFLAITSVARPESEIIVIEPAFVLFEAIARYAGASVRRIVTRASEAYQVDPQEVIDAMGPRTAAVILNSPGNPTGAVYPAETIRAICEEAARRGITVISDEVYDHLVFAEGEYPSVLKLAPSLTNVMVVSSFSKTYSMPGLRVGWVVSSEENIQTLRRYHMFTTCVGSTPAQWAGVAALQGDQSGVRLMAQEYRKRRDLVVERVSDIPQFTGYRPEGAFFIMPSLPAGADGADVAMRMLLETGVCTVPGGTFGTSCRSALRISYAAKIEQINAAFDRIGPWLAKQSF